MFSNSGKYFYKGFTQFSTKQYLWGFRGIKCILDEKMRSVRRSDWNSLKNLVRGGKREGGIKRL